jgi:hypothetical protein
MARPLILDGITVQLAAELFFDAGTERNERARTKALYGNALCDLSFAVLFGDSLGTVGSLGTRSSPGSVKNVSPGQLLINHDKEAVFRTKFGATSGKVEDILRVESVRSALMEDLEAVSGDFGRASGLHELWSISKMKPKRISRQSQLEILLQMTARMDPRVLGFSTLEGIRRIFSTAKFNQE